VSLRGDSTPAARPLRRRSDLKDGWPAPDERTLEGLVRLGALLTSTLSLADAAAQIVEYGCIITGLPAFMLLIKDEQAPELRTVAFEGVPDYASDVRLRLIDLAALDLEHGGPCVIDVEALASPDLVALAARHRLSLAWVAPIIVEGTRLLGVLIGLDRRPLPPTGGELHVFRLLALQATSAVWNAERYEAEKRANEDLLRAEREIAVTLQKNFIHPLPEVEGVDLAVVSQTAHDPELVGGDFHDVFELPDGRLVILLGDVEGKGVPAAGMTETVRTAVSTLALVYASPDFILGKTNEYLLSHRGAERQMVTAFLLILDVRTGQVSYASAGHPAPAVLSASSCGYLDASYGLPLGSFAGDYSVRNATLAPGDSIVLYSDGLIEARRGPDLFGEQRLLQTLDSLRGLDLERVLECLRDAALDHAGTLSDDLHLLAFRLTRSQA
jgi:serine phosphatase RsbU (regulator of sigma subunit)